MYEVSSWDKEHEFLNPDDVVALVTKSNNEGGIYWLQAKYACKLHEGKFRHVIYIIQLVNYKVMPPYLSLDDIALGMLIDEVCKLFDKPLFNFKFVNHTDKLFALADLREAGFCKMLVPLEEPCLVD